MSHPEQSQQASADPQFVDRVIDTLLESRGRLRDGDHESAYERADYALRQISVFLAVLGEHRKSTGD